MDFLFFAISISGFKNVHLPKSWCCSWIIICADKGAFFSFSMLALLYFKFFFRPILVLKCDQGFVGYKASFWGLCLFCPIHFYQLKRANKPFLSHMDHCAAESAVSFFFRIVATSYIIWSEKCPWEWRKKNPVTKDSSSNYTVFSVAKYGTAKNIDSPHC